jgi:hypothetical protein
MLRGFFLPFLERSSCSSCSSNVNLGWKADIAVETIKGQTDTRAGHEREPMVIRRIREHVAALNWFAVGIDFLIVVAGIIIAMQVTNWNQARVERSQGAVYRERLIADLRANEVDLLERRTYYRSGRHRAEAALMALDSPVGVDGGAFLVDAYLASPILTRQPKRFTYDELVSTGRTGQIGDVALRELVADYYVQLNAIGALLNFVPPYREHIRARMPHAAQQAIRRQCGGSLAAMVKDCKIHLDSRVLSRSVTAVRSSPDTAPGLTRLIADFDLKLNMIEDMVRRERRLRAAIAKA